MKLSKDGKCVVIALFWGEKVTVLQDKIAVVLNDQAFEVNRLEFDALEEMRLVVVEESGPRITGRGRVWAKKWWGELFGFTDDQKAKAERMKSLSRVRLRRGNRRGR
jgi:hypothetical protein